ncbi:MAG TPA: GNAT family N-acetyltransferase [Phototrophicaceae bacterium]|jgi:predicted GNAT family N-acyltransferase|nr:GNAT family N-acetyltransferase [Phototrophicaceae bacterium]
MVSIQITREAELSPALIHEMNDYYHEVFVEESATAEYWLPNPEWRLIVFDDQLKWMTTLEIHDKVIKVDGKEVRVGGIGGVVTLPEYRGQKHAERAMRRAVLFINEELHASFGMLFCFPKLVPYYERLGWQRMTAADLVYRDSTGAPRHFTDSMGAMTYEASGQPFPSGQVDLGGYPW